MKKIKILGLLIIAMIGFNSCESDDDLVFTAHVPAEGVTFSNTFLDEYVLTNAASTNLAERFTWSDANFDVPTSVSYELQKSIIGDFSEEEIVIGSTEGNELAVTIGQMLGYAAEAGLDNDPNTTDKLNTGQIYFRVRAFIGLDGLEAFSVPQALTVVLPEDTGGAGGIEISTWGVVGSAANDWGAHPDIPFYTTDQANVIVSYANLKDGEIKFRENNDWVNSFGDANGDNILDTDNDNNIAVTAGDYKITIDFNDNSYTIEAYSWGIVGSAYNDWGAFPDAKLFYDYTTDTFKVGVKLLDGDMKIRMNNAWDVSYGDLTGDNVFDTDADNNIAVTAGFYMLTVNFKDLSYTLEAANLWGVVGSGYNDWGATPDAMFTEVSPGKWIAENVTLIDGEIKFRVNEAWDTSFGDVEPDGVLDTENDNNIAVTAGTYDIRLDIDALTYTLTLK